MSAPLRIGAFVAICAAVFAAAAVAGAALDPDVDENGGDHAEETTSAEHSDDGAGDVRGGGAESEAASLPGLAVAEGGLRLVPVQSAYEPSADATFRFEIVDDAGEPARDFDRTHERRMHLIIVRRDFAGFQHLHPRQLRDGSWEAHADLSRPGVHRVFADFSSAGEALTLGTDLFVQGEFEPLPLPAVENSDSAGDGYEVTIDSPNARPGRATPVEFTVTRDGRPVDGVQPYLGADGHLVALREHDQAFLHTHPEGEPGGPGPIRFEVTYPTAGRYRLFLQFKHEGEVRTVAFTQQAGGKGAPVASPPAADSDAHEDDGHGH